MLTALKDGKQIADIPNFYAILELYPKKTGNIGTKMMKMVQSMEIKRKDDGTIEGVTTMGDSVKGKFTDEEKETSGNEKEI